MSTDRRALLSLAGVTAGYGVSTVLDGVDLSVRNGQVVALLGANGVGKTTLLRVAAGLLAPRSGRLEFHGRHVERLPAHRMARLGLAHVPEGRGIFPGLTVRENLALGGFSHPKRRDDVMPAEEVLALFPVLTQRMNQKGGTLSGGEQQMLAVARALLMRPSLLLLDEPSLGMAPLVVQGMFDALARVKQAGVAMLLAEQAAKQALTIADYVYVLGSGGRVVASGTAAEIASSSVVYESYMS
ncbi:MAG TPA: ABC transporter ATP-binding protein [Amycolatopsis sp.]|nr:ABC transporter ATP-binding protein [Amycolatopsis sp.]